MFHTQPLFSCLVYWSIIITLHILAQYSKHQATVTYRLGIQPQDLGLPNKYSLGHGMAFLLLLDTNLLSQAGITH